MQAAVLEHYGSPQNFQLKEVPKPTIEEGQVLLLNYASSVNPIDVLVREGTLRLFSGLLGEPIIGTDYCGTVVESRSSRYAVGDELFGCVAPTTGHAYAELVVVNEDETALKPANLSYTEAAALALVGLTAYQALVHKGRLQAGQRVLINGCTGGVGSAAVQIAKTLGAHITGICQAEHMAAAREMGCDEVRDYKTQSLPTDHAYDLVFDNAAKITLADAERALTPTGLFVTTKPDYSSVGAALTTAADFLDSRLKLVKATPTTADFTQLRTWMEAGQLRPYIACTFPLGEVARAHEMLEKGGFVGKVAISIA